MIDPSTIAFKDREDRESHERFMKRVADLQAQIEADPSVGRRLMQQAGIWDENGQLMPRYRDDADDDEN
ncbi:MAG TPA: hypothetical protein VF627_04340 [Abditibacterium sp.]|jgi:hypothetical protein